MKKYILLIILLIAQSGYSDTIDFTGGGYIVHIDSLSIDATTKDAITNNCAKKSDLTIIAESTTALKTELAAVAESTGAIGGGSGVSYAVFYDSMTRIGNERATVSDLTTLAVSTTAIGGAYYLFTDSVTYGTAFTSSPITFNMVANGSYLVEMFCVFQTTITTDGINFTLGLSGAYTILAYNWFVPISATTQVISNRRIGWAGTTGTAVDVANSNCIANGRAVIVNGAGANTLVVGFAGELATSKSTLKAGSFIRWRKTN